MTRDEMIRLLVLDRLEYSDDLARYLHLQGVLENGFRGFRALSDHELAAEIQALGLDRRLDAADGPDDDLDAFADDNLFDASLSVGHVFILEQSADFSQ
ncbi:MAG: hypothetical protein CVU33_00105 [Betaproteobacteria bacterium HGW-Betaproteobacteria-6]|jgi:hypothetical protein|nr:MAG: hypothetical protein CVU33_00105 [Betaproteobacteria bacterium HGW-Betaproteobacteria-6]